MSCRFTKSFRLGPRRAKAKLAAITTYFAAARAYADSLLPLATSLI